MKVSGLRHTLAALLPAEIALVSAQAAGWAPQLNSQSGHFGEEENFLNVSGIEQFFICPAYSSPVTVPITHVPHVLSKVSPGFSCQKIACFRQKGGIEAAQATRQKWIEDEHRKITDSVTGNLLYLRICKQNHPSQPYSRLVTLLKLIYASIQVSNKLVLCYCVCLKVT
jgi:hypothetical protein